MFLKIIIKYKDYSAQNYQANKTVIANWRSEDRKHTQHSGNEFSIY